ncbi:MAG: glycosyltransferase, partial [Promethearchaeota archaeon]
AGLHNRESLGGNILLFKSGNTDSLADTLIGMLSKPSAMAAISQKQIQYAKRENWSLAAARTIRHYHKTLR